MPYTKQTWNDNDPAYPGSASRFLHMEDGIFNAQASAEAGGVAAAPTGVAATDTATVLAAMQAGTRLADGNYVCTATGLNGLAAGTKVMLQGQGSGRTTITMPPTSYGIASVQITGSSVGSAYALTAQANLGDNTLTISSANATSLAANPGDYLHMWGQKVIPTTVPNGAMQGEIVRVKSVNTGTGVITLYGTVDDTYALADSPKLKKLSLLDGCYVKGITFVNSAPLTGASTAIQATRTRGLVVEDVYVVAGDGPGVQLFDSVEAKVKVNVRDLADDGANSRYGYGVLAWGSTRDCDVTVYAERCRHAFTTGAESRSGSLAGTDPLAAGVPRHIDIRGIARETTDVGWDSHSEGDDLRYWITSVACQGAFQARAKNVKLMSWSFQNCRDASYLFWTATGFRAMPGASRGTKTGNASVFRVGDTSGNVLTDVKFFGLHSDADGHVATLQNCSDVVFVEPVITNPTGAAFINSGGISNVQIILPVTDGVSTMISGGTTGITTINTPGTAPINVAAAPYNAKGDYRTLTDGAITTGTPNFSSATAGFTSADVGKSINVQGAGAAGAVLATTILSVTSSTAVVLNANAGTTVSGATFGYGTNNKATIVSALAATPATTLYFPAGNYYCDMSAGSFSLADGHTIMGDGWTSIITFGPEGQNASANFFAQNAGTVRFERIRLVAPTTIGASGTVFALAQSSSAVRALFRDVNFRLFSDAAQSAVASTIEMQSCEVEGRTSGGANSIAINHTATTVGGAVICDDCFFWNLGLGSNQYIQAGTCTALDLHKCRFDLQTGTGAVVSHNDASGLTTVTPYSRIRDCQFGSGLTGLNVRTPYQGCRCQITDCDFLGNVIMVDVRGLCEIQNCRFSMSAAASINMITTTVTSSSVPSLRMTGCRFDGPANTTTIAINLGTSGSIAEAEIDDNDFLLGDSTNKANVHILVGAIGSTNRVEIRNNRFGGNTNNNGAIRCQSGIVSITANTFYGSFTSSNVITCDTGTLAALHVRNNEFSQATNVPSVTLTTTPTIVDIAGNYGPTTVNGGGTGYHSVSGSATQTATDEVIGVTSTAAPRVITLLAGTKQTVGRVIEITDESGAASGTNTITATCAGADTFVGGGTTKVINSGGGILRFYWNGTNFVPA